MSEDHIESAGRPSGPSFLCLGVSHRTADVALRETLQRGLGRLETELVTSAGLGWRLLEWAPLSTCNRWELYAVVEGRPWAFEAWLRDRIGGYAGIDRVRLAGALRRWEGHQAVRHLYEVASGVDSMVLGESEILGQVKRAAVAARERGALGGTLSVVFRDAVRVGRRVRHETEIGRRRATVSWLAVGSAEQRVDRPLEHARVLVVGLGELGHLTVGALRRRGVGSIGVVNRSAERARALARDHGLRWWPIAELDAALVWAHVVFSCAASAEPLIGPAAVASAVADARHPKVLVDLAVPRNVDPACGGLDGVELLALDDLGGEARRAVERRRSALPAVRRIVLEELRRFEHDQRCRAVEPAIRELRQWSDAVRAEELERLRRATGELDEAAWAAIEEFSRSLTDKLLHHPTARLRESATSGSSEEHLRALRRLFGPELRRRRDSASA